MVNVGGLIMGHKTENVELTVLIDEIRLLYNQPEVTVVLSGMNSIEMVKENCRVASDSGEGNLNESDLKLLEEIKRKINILQKWGE